MRNLELSTESKILREELEQTKHEYATAFAQLDYMNNHERESLNILYLNTIGREEYENYKLNIEVKSLKMKVEYAQITLNRNEKPDVKQIEKEVNYILNEFYNNLKKKAVELEMAQDTMFIRTDDMNELKAIYKMLVKRLHPDLHPDQEPWEKDMFYMAQFAYKTANLGKLHEILMKLEVEDKTIKFDSNDEIKAYIQKLKESIASIKEQIKLLENSFPFKFKNKLHDKNWIGKRKDELAEERKNLEAEKSKYAERWELIKEVRWEK